MNYSESFRNRYPIVLVHGITGWGRDEVMGFKYWGGTTDIQSRLNELHFHTMTAAVGPVSSSWERAVELYHYLLGGRVDYGAAHAAKYGVKRFGRTFPGLYSQISDINKVHLVGHSMGAQTICDFQSLLREGSQTERDYHQAHPESEGISELFLGGRDWVHSITGIAPGFNGSIALNPNEGPLGVMSLMSQMLLRLAAIAGADPHEFVYDFKLDQWGLKREPDEPLVQYLERVHESTIWKSGNTALYDLSMHGAEKIARERLHIYPDTYYFSFTGKATFTHPVTGFALPLLTINPMFYEGAKLQGRMNIDPELPGTASDWRNGDGCVSCGAGLYVLGQPHRDADPADLSFPPGIWNSFPVMNGWDHFAIVGIEAPHVRHQRDVMPFYSDIARMLTATEPPVGEVAKAPVPQVAHKAATKVAIAKPHAKAAKKSPAKQRVH